MYEKDELRIIERMLFQNPEAEIDDFPPLDEHAMECQENAASSFDYLLHGRYLFAYVRECDSSICHKAWFIDIYVYYFDINENLQRRRLVIAPGYQMQERQEQEFLYNITTDFIFYDTRTCSVLLTQLNELIPEIHLKEYSKQGMMLAHVYFACIKGFREIIWKVGGLENIAMNLHLIENWNLLGKNVEEALEVPVKMLRKLNSRGNAEETLRTASGRNATRNIYLQYHTILNKFEHLNQFQMRYLKECYETGIDKKDIDRHMLQVIGEIESGYDDEEFIDGSVIYYQYIDYINLIGDVKAYHHIFPRYPSLSLNNLCRFTKVYQFLYYYLENGEEIEKTFRRLLKNWSALSYENEEDPYVIMPIRKLQEIMNESQAQCNCVYSYLLDILEGKTTIVFMREKENPEMPLITIEIYDNRISQALLAYNKSINDETQLRFLRKYAREKNLLIAF